MLSSHLEVVVEGSGVKNEVAQGIGFIWVLCLYGQFIFDQ
jgi:hypothetical protein